MGGCSSQQHQIPGGQTRICAGDTRETNYCGRSGRRARPGPAARRRARGMGQKETAVTNKNRIMIYGPKTDGTYIVEFKTAAGEALTISVPAGETRVLKHFQERMP